MKSLTQNRFSAVIPFVVVALALFLLAPAVLSDFRLNLLARYLCFAIVAVGIGLAWGSGGMLTLGQGVFFGLGAYAMGLHMKLDDAGAGHAPNYMPPSTQFLPGWMEMFRSGIVTIIAIVALPALVALILGLATFKRKVRGAYFAILSQALAAAFATLIIVLGSSSGNYTNGTNGLNNFRSFFGYDITDPVNKKMLYYIAAGFVLLVVAVVRQLRNSRYGELLRACQSSEERVRFLGYDPANVKTVAYVIAAAMAGIGGALFVPIVGIITPQDVGIAPSIAMLIGVAIGGRGTLWGPVLGAVGVSWAQSTLSEQFPAFWTYFQGALFIVVIAFLPGGLASIGSVLRSVRGFVETKRATRAEPPANPVAAVKQDAGSVV
jgi:urea transport system permease protein